MSFALCPLQANEETRRKLCVHLGQQALAGAPSITQEKWLHQAGSPPRSPKLPVGSVWGLVNHIKVMHQYTELLSAAVCGEGPHVPLLRGLPESCVGSLDCFAPLCVPMGELQCAQEYQEHVEIWRKSNPGLFSHAEAAYHVHQAYLEEDPHMTRFLVSKMLSSPMEYEVAIAGNMLRASPTSFDDFSRDFTNWRRNGVYHTLCLGARLMPEACQWIPEHLMHESQDWQALLDDFNRSSFCSEARLEEYCEKLSDRSPKLSNFICALLDRACILTRVKSNHCGAESLDECLHGLNFESDPRSPYTHSLMTWGTLKQTLEASVPPLLLCPAVGHSLHRDTWGYPRLELRMESNNTLYIHTGPLKWVGKDTYEPCDFDASLERMQDILFRLGDAATSPEIACLMLYPKKFSMCFDLNSESDDIAGDVPLLESRASILEAMHCPNLKAEANEDYATCISSLVSCLPNITTESFANPLHLITWRMDLPSKAILYQGTSHTLDLSISPPYLLPKTVLLDKIPNRTTSGISIVPSEVDAHTAIRACLSQEIIGKHPDFMDHPMHQISARVPAAFRANESLKSGFKIGAKLGASTNGSNIGARMDTRMETSPRKFSGPKTPNPVSIHTSTTLAEAVSLFSGKQPQNLTEISLHESVPWEAEHIDDRYAEKQHAENGVRYRDWATLHRDDEGLHRCRLAMHRFTVNEIHHTLFPLVVDIRGGTNSSPQSWISVASTIPAETRVLRHIGGKNQVDILKKSIENRFINDTKLLPVRFAGDWVERPSVEIYTDEEACQVALVYAPCSEDGTRRTLELMSFRLA